MKLPENLPNIKDFKWVLITVAIFCLIAILLIGIGFVFASKYEAKVFLGVRVNGQKLSGLTKEQAKQVIEDQVQKTLAPGIRFSYGQKVEVIELNEANIIRVNADQMAERAYNLGRNQADWINWLIRAKLLIQGANIQFDFDLDKESVIELFEAKFAKDESPAVNSDVKITILDEDKKKYELSFIEEKAGTRLNYNPAFSEFTRGLIDFQNITVPLTLKQETPTISKSEAEAFKNELEELLKLDGLTLTYENKDFTIGWPEYTKWLGLIKTADKKIEVALNEKRVLDYLKVVSLDIDQPGQDAKLKIENGRAVEFEAPEMGLAVQLDKSFEKTSIEILKNRKTNIELIVEAEEPNVTLASLNNLGINEKLGVGYSNFSGSPSNRISNIKHAAYNKLNGYIVQPDEEFSLLNTLKPFTYAGGYLAELVIRGDKIEPEVGGGLCQIGTTMFRTAMNSGMPITQRSNHSLVVSYYNDHRNGNPGTDATIYDPSPDFKFINDTGTHILITAYMNVNTGELYFTFWGTSDGRKGYYTEPVVLSWIGAGPAKEIKTNELAPGKRKCQGSHVGAKTTFTYIRTLANGEKEENVYDSSYRALPTICLVGAGGEEGKEPTCEGEGCNDAVTEETNTEIPVEALLDIEAPVDETPAPPSKPVDVPPVEPPGEE